MQRSAGKVAFGANGEGWAGFWCPRQTQNYGLRGAKIKGLTNSDLGITLSLTLKVNCFTFLFDTTCYSTIIVHHRC